MPKKHVLLESESDNEESFNDERLPTDENDNASVDVESVDMDEYLRRGGECGRYQIWVVTLITITVTPLTFPILIFYYIGHDPMWSCANNATSTFCKNNTNVYEHDDKERCSIPRSEWMYHTSGRTTFATEFDLVCDRAWLDALNGSVVFIGWGVGSILMGLLSDRFGRRNVMFPSFLACLLCLLLHAVVQDIYQLLIIRVLMGFFVAAPALNNYILMLEIVGPNRRALVSGFAGFLFPLSGLILTLKAYFIKNWKLLTIICSAPYFLPLLLGICIPESIRWLSLKGRLKDAEEILQRSAVWNKKVLPPLALKPIETLKGTKKSASYLDLFKKCKIIKVVFAQIFVWFNSGMTYYALSWAFADLGGDMYLNFVMSLFVELPGVFISNYLMHRCGRKKTTAGMFFGTFIFCIAVAPIPKSKGGLKTLRVVLGLSGKFMIASAFSCIYLWSSEIYPTIVSLEFIAVLTGRLTMEFAIWYQRMADLNNQSQGMGINIIASRAGAATSPFIKLLDKLHPAAPFATVGITSLLATLCSLTLPETLNQATRETLDDFDGKKSFEMVAVCSMERETVKFNGDLAEEASSGSDEYVECLDEGEEETDLLLTPPVRILSATE